MLIWKIKKQIFDCLCRYMNVFDSKLFNFSSSGTFLLGEMTGEIVTNLFRKSQRIIRLFNFWSTFISFLFYLIRHNKIGLKHVKHA